MKSKRLFILLAVALSSVGCEIDSGNDENLYTDKDPEVENVSATLKSTIYYPFDVVNIDMHGLSIDKEEYSATLNSETIVVSNQKDGTLAFPLSNLEPGNYTLSLNINNEDYQFEFEVRPFPTLANPEEILNEVSAQMNQIVVQTNGDNGLSANEKLLFQNLHTAFVQEFANLSEADRLLFAQYCSVHPEIFGGVPDAMLKSSRQKNLEMARVFIKRTATVSIVVGAICVAAKVPDLTISKLIAIGAATALALELYELSILYIQVKGIEIITEDIGFSQGQKTVLLSEPLKSTNSNEFTFWDGESPSEPVAATLRSLYYKDLNNSKLSSSVKQLISSMNTYQSIYSRVEAVVNSTINFLSLGSTPKLIKRSLSISETKTYTSTQELLERGDYTFGVISGSVVYNGGFRTSSNKDQNFKFAIYDKTNDILSEEYPALLKKIPFRYEDFSLDITGSCTDGTANSYGTCTYGGSFSYKPQNKDIKVTKILVFNFSKRIPSVEKDYTDFSREGYLVVSGNSIYNSASKAIFSFDMKRSILIDWSPEDDDDHFRAFYKILVYFECDGIKLCYQQTFSTLRNKLYFGE